METPNFQNSNNNELLTQNDFYIDNIDHYTGYNKVSTRSNSHFRISSSINFVKALNTKSFMLFTDCIIKHILTTTNLTNLEKIYYLLADSLSIINNNIGGNRSCSLSGDDWAARIGCSRSLVFTMQKSLARKGYFIISKDFDIIGRNKRNLITPTLPPSVFNNLNERFPDRVGEHTPYNPLIECKRAYLDRTKLFIKLNYNLLKIIAAFKDLNPQQKVTWLGFYTACYKNYMWQTRESFNLNKYGYSKDPSFSFSTSYKELAEQYSCHTKYISKSIRNLEKLGFIKAQNIYLRNHYDDTKYGTNNEDYYGNALNKTQERQDKSLWRITLTLPDHYILELEKLKNRSSIPPTDIKVATSKEVPNTNKIEDCIVLGGVKFQLNSKQSTLLKSLIKSDPASIECPNNNATDTDNISTISSLNNESYVDSIMKELDEPYNEGIEDRALYANKLMDNSSSTDSSKDLSEYPSLCIEALDRYDEKSDGIKSDPHVAKSGLLLNKDLKINIKEFKSNLGASPKVIFNNFLKKFSNNKKYQTDQNTKNPKKDKKNEFNILSELIRENLKSLPKDKADKARKFAYALISKGLATGYAASLSKGELAKQLIYHAASWKPTKLGSIAKDKEIDTALAVAWKAVISGKWQIPQQYAKAEILQHEYNYYKEKYRSSGVLSLDISSLEVEVNKLLGGWCNLGEKIIAVSKVLPGTEEVSVNSTIKGLKSNPRNNNNTSETSLNNQDTLLEQNSEGSGSNQNNYESDLVVNYHNSDLLNLVERQQYLGIITNNYEHSHIETIGNINYHLNCKEIDTYTLRDTFFDTKHLKGKGLQDKNIIEAKSPEAVTEINNHGDNKQLLGDEHREKGFIRIDEALLRIFTKGLS